MPTRYGRDLRCRGSNPGLQAGQGQEREQGDQEQEDQEQEQGEQEQIESQEHLESCPGYSELWQGLTHLCQDVGSSRK